MTSQAGTHGAGFHPAPDALDSLSLRLDSNAALLVRPGLA